MRAVSLIPNRFPGSLSLWISRGHPPLQASRTFFVLSEATRGVNQALASFKADVCGPHRNGRPNANLERSLRLEPEHVERKRLQEAKFKAKARIAPETGLRLR